MGNLRDGKSKIRLGTDTTSAYGKTMKLALIVVILCGCSPAVERAADVERSADRTASPVEKLRLQINAELDELERLTAARNIEMEREEGRWFDEQLKRSHVEQVHRRYRGLILAQEAKIQRLREGVDTAQLAEEGIARPTSDQIKQESIEALKKKLSELSDAWTSLDDAESEALNDAKQRFSGSDRDSKTQEILGRFEPAKKAMMDQKRDIEDRISQLGN